MALARSSRWLRYASRSARSRATWDRSLSGISSIVVSLSGSRGATSGLPVAPWRECMDAGAERFEMGLVVQRLDHRLGAADRAHEQEVQPLVVMVVAARGVVDVSARAGGAGRVAPLVHDGRCGRHLRRSSAVLTGLAGPWMEDSARAT